MDTINKALKLVFFLGFSWLCSENGVDGLAPAVEIINFFMS